MVKLKIDNVEVEVDEKLTILEAAKTVGIQIPTLCYLKDINEVGNCRMCLVEVEGMKSLVTSCTTKVAENMVVRTSSKEIIKHRKNNLQLLLSNHNKSCLTCIRSTNCELQDLAHRFQIKDIKYEGEKTSPIYDDSSLCITRDTSKCILCGRCVNVCSKVQTVDAITKVKRGFETYIGVATPHGIVDSTCVGCGQCIVNCPVGALSEKDYIEDVINALNDKTKHVVVQVAPAVRATIGEEFSMKIGSLVTGKLVACLKMLGFDKVFDTDMAADLTIVEEGTEFLERLKNSKTLPMITSCSSGWITFAEKFFPDLLKHLSSAKSPMEMMGTVIKTYYAKKNKLDPKDIYSVAIMPCSAKKAEIVRESLKIDGMQMVDTVLTTRELARMIKRYSIDLKEVADKEFDSPFGEATGAGHLFGTTGGVMEAALRELSKKTNNEVIKNLRFVATPDSKDIREAKIKLGDREINVAIADGLANVRILMEKIANGTNKYDFIEVMTCPGGCIMGGGQPIIPPNNSKRREVKLLRAAALYKADNESKNKVSDENKAVQKIYKEFIGVPNGKKAHKYLHTHYKKQEVYNT